jgi:TrmH family RNA methyltransferase
MVISSRDNERWKAMRRLARSKGKRRSAERDLLLVEGVHLLEAALDAGLEPETVLATPELVAAAPPLLDRLPRAPLLIAPSLLEELADADSPRGLLAAVRLADRGAETLAEVARGGDAGPIVLADGIQDPANLGALARTCEAAGAMALITTPGSVGWRHPRSLRASTGSLLRLPVFAGLEPDSVEQALRPFGTSWVALVPRGGEDLFASVLEGRVLVAVGAEGAGLGARVAELAHRRLTVPLAPGVESLNAHVAAAVVLFELRRRGLVAAGPPGGIPPRSR